MIILQIKSGCPDEGSRFFDSRYCGGYCVEATCAQKEVLIDKSNYSVSLLFSSHILRRKS